MVYLGLTFCFALWLIISWVDLLSIVYFILNLFSTSLLKYCVKLAKDSYLAAFY